MRCLPASLASIPHSVTNPRVIAYHGAHATLSALVEAQHLPRGDHSRHLLLKNIHLPELSRDKDRWTIEDMNIRTVWLTGEAAVLFPARRAGRCRAERRPGPDRCKERTCTS